jgi:transposase
VAGKAITVKKYVVRLDAAERDQLTTLIHKGKGSAQLLTKARILLKADVSELGEGWSDSAIAAALDTGIATVERTRRQLLEEGFAAVLKRIPNSARPRIFDGAAEAKLIALTLSPAPEGFARWSLRLLEEKVVELNIVEKASDNTIGRTLKKSLLPRLYWIAHERRRDLARCDGSRDRASMIFQPCFLAVETKERMSAKSIAPCNDRKPPEIF